ncbi:MAG: hypothetical protein WAX77_03255 [Methylococcaceae bacterium]
MKTKQSKILALLALLIFSVMSIHVFAKEIETASANGKYAQLLKEISCPKDSAQYGKFTDYGYWEGGLWCGQQGPAGYWVWLKPTWYVWGYKVQDNH